MTPPRIAQLVMLVAVDPPDRAFLLSDLQEEFEKRTRSDGAVAARRWYRHQVARSILPSFLRRITKRGRRRPRRHRPQRGATAMDTFVQDVRFALRTLRARPSFTAVAVLTLSIGIGANIAIFSFVNGVLFKSVPGLHDTAGLVEISRNVEGRFWDMSFPVYEQLRNQSDVLEDAAAFSASPVSVGQPSGPTAYMSVAVTGSYFDVLRMRPVIGRFFAPTEASFPQVAPVVVISHRLWERSFAADPQILGTTIQINGRSAEIIGVTSAGFSGHAVGLQLDLFVPMGLDVPGLRSPRELRGPRNGVIEVLGRMPPGVRTAQAAATLSTIAGQYLESIDGTPDDARYVVRVESWAPVPAMIRGGVQAFLAVLMTIVTIVLIMACVNVAGMLLSRTTERRNEIAVRLALGAGRGRVVRQLLTESLVLFSLAGVAGALVAQWAVTLLLAFEPPLPAGFDVELRLGLDWRVIAFATAITMITGILFSLTPALQATRPDVVPDLKDDSRGVGRVRTRTRNVLVAGQVAFTMTLLIAAGLFLRALQTLKSLDPGWVADDVHVMALDLELTDTDQAEGRQFYNALLEQARAIPGVEAAAVAAKLPLAGRSSFGQINVPGVSAPEGASGYDAFLNRVSPEYFRTLSIPMLRGRDIDGRDRDESSNVAVINRAMAERFWGDASPIGQRFYAGSVESGIGFEVVGVVENAKYRRLTEETPNFYYLPHRQWYDAQMTLHLLVTPGNDESITTEVRQLVRRLDTRQPLQPVRHLSETLAVFLLPQRLAAWVAGVMGMIGLLLGTVGIYGVTAFAVGQRKREIGVRLALGANALDVIRLTVRQGMASPAIGLAIGIAMAVLLSQALSRVVPGVPALDPFVFATVVAGTGLVALAAILIPAARAARLDPVSTLRTE